MMFDERQLQRHHVLRAIEKYLVNKPDHYAARSAFLNHGEHKLPAKFILRMSFQELTGVMPKSEQITGGKASVKLLQRLGFDAIYLKPPKRASRNPIKSARREAFKKELEKYWGKVETEYRFSEIRVPDLDKRKDMDPDLLKVLKAIESERNISVKGRKNYRLSCDFYLPDIHAIFEFDERQHFTLLRAASLRAYPSNIQLGFSLTRWIELSSTIQAGDNSPIYRDEQRAFYDSIRDILAPKIGLKPVVRIFEEDVFWEKEMKGFNNCEVVLENIQAVLESEH